MSAEEHITGYISMISFGFLRWSGRQISREQIFCSRTNFAWTKTKRVNIFLFTDSMSEQNFCSRVNGFAIIINKIQYFRTKSVNKNLCSRMNSWTRFCSRVGDIFVHGRYTKNRVNYSRKIDMFTHMFSRYVCLAAEQLTSCMKHSFVHAKVGKT